MSFTIIFIITLHLKKLTDAYKAQIIQFYHWLILQQLLISSTESFEMIGSSSVSIKDGIGKTTDGGQ